MRTIITVEEAKTLGRPIGQKVSNEKITSFIKEVEDTIIRKSIGDELFITIVEVETEDELQDEIKTLLNGGRYKDKCGNVHLLTGLKTAEAYYVYAQNVRAGDFESTRYGMVLKDDPYSQGISTKERDQIANSATEVADCYLQECLAYCRSIGIKTNSINNSTRITSGCVIRKIG